MRFFRPALAIGAAMLVAAVGDAQTRRDSAGVHIYSYSVQQLAASGLRADLAPHFTISGSPRDSSMAEGVTGVHRLDNGHLLVAVAYPDHGPAIPSAAPKQPAAAPPRPKLAWIELREYDTVGVLQSRRGGRIGSNPGQFDAPLDFVGMRKGDTIVASANQGSTPYLLPIANRPPYAVMLPRATEINGVLPDGSLVGWIGMRRLPVPKDSTVLAWSDQDSLTLVRVEPTLLRSTDIGATLSRPVARSLRPPLAAALAVEASPFTGAVGDRIWFMDQLHWTLLFFDRNGTLQTMVQLPRPSRNAAIPARGVVPRDSFYVLKSFTDEAQRLWIQASETAPAPLLKTSDGTTRSTIGNRAPHDWWVFMADGTFVGTTTLPDNFQPFDAGKDFIVGTQVGPGGTAPLVLFGLSPIRSSK